MIALLLDPHARSISHVETDGSEETIAAMLDTTRLDVESYLPDMQSRIRVYRATDKLERPDVPGYVIEHTGGVVNHGRCLVFGVDGYGRLTDVPYVRITYVYLPGKGAFEIGSDPEDG